MTDIWDDKPIYHSSETRAKFNQKKHSWEYQLKIEYDKLKEKAEKWDKYTLDGKNITPEIIEQIEELEQKLEAVKTWFREGLDLKTPDMHKLHEILGDQTSTETET